MPDLLDWNDALAERYLVPGDGTEEVLMCATWEDIYEIGQRGHLDGLSGFNNEMDPAESRSDFLQAILQGPRGADWDDLIGSREHPFVIAAKLSDDSWKDVRSDGSFPPYIAYMVFCVIAASDGDGFTSHNYWDRMWGILEDLGYSKINEHTESGGRPVGFSDMSGAFKRPGFKRRGLRMVPTFHPMSPSRARMWGLLNEWCEDNGYLIFYTRRGAAFGASFVERYFQHALVTSEDLRVTLPGLFHKQMKALGDNPQSGRLRSLVWNQKVATFSLRFERTRDDGSDEHRRALISQIRLCHQRWVADGCRGPSTPIGQGDVELGARTATVILQLDSPYGDNFEDGCQLHARVRVTGDPPFDVLGIDIGGVGRLRGKREVTQQNGAHLSTRLRRLGNYYPVENLRWESGLELPGRIDDEAGARFIALGKALRIFIRSSDRRIGLPGGGWTEWNGFLRPGEEILLLCHRSEWDQALSWNGNIMDYHRILKPNDLYEFPDWGVLIGTRRDFYIGAQDGISGEMVLSRTARVQSIGHIRNGVKSHLSYFSFGAPMVRVSGIDNPEVTIDGEDVDGGGGVYLLHPSVAGAGMNRVRIKDAGHPVNHSYKRIRITDSRVQFNSEALLRDHMGTPVDSTSQGGFSGAVIHIDEEYTPPKFDPTVVGVVDRAVVGIDLSQAEVYPNLSRNRKRRIDQQAPYNAVLDGDFKIYERAYEECWGVRGE